MFSDHLYISFGAVSGKFMEQQESCNIYFTTLSLCYPVLTPLMVYRMTQIEEMAVPPVLSPRRVMVVHNPTAGRNRGKRLQMVLDLLQAKGCEVVTRETLRCRGIRPRRQCRGFRRHRCRRR